MYSVQLQTYKDLLRECFATDKDLIEKWHIEAGNGLETCVDRTYNDLKSWDIKVFSLVEDGKIVGYYGIEGTVGLTGFFLKPEFRDKKHVEEFWNIVDSNFDNNYFIGVYEKNTRAVEFLKRKSDLWIKENDSIFFVVKKEK